MVLLLRAMMTEQEQLAAVTKRQVDATLALANESSRSCEPVGRWSLTIMFVAAARQRAS